MTSYDAMIELAAHLYREHGLGWEELKHRFPGMGVHFWNDVALEVAA